MTGFEYLGYLFGGFLYLSSDAFRDKKKREWQRSGARYKVHEIGMWVTIPLTTTILIAIALLI